MSQTEARSRTAATLWSNRRINIAPYSSEETESAFKQNGRILAAPPPLHARCLTIHHPVRVETLATTAAENDVAGQEDTLICFVSQRFEPEPSESARNRRDEFLQK
jgi:hypothetical protein